MHGSSSVRNQVRQLDFERPSHTFGAMAKNSHAKSRSKGRAGRRTSQRSKKASAKPAPHRPAATRVTLASVPSSRWSVANVFGWFALTGVVALFLLDGSINALADRLTAPRSQGAAPVLGAPSQVAAADDDVDPVGPGASTATAVASGGSNTSGVALDAALTNGCVAGSDAPCKRTALDAFWANAKAARNNKLGRALRVSFYGDSVVASDLIPAALRQLMWKEFGNGGPGFVYVVPPHRFCSNEAIKRSSSGTWQVNAVSTTLVADRWFGAGNSSAQAQDGSAKLSVTDGEVHKLTLHYVAQPDGGSVTLSTEHGDVGVIDTQATTKAAMSKRFAVPDGFANVSFAASGKVRVFGMELENETGAVVDNLGVVSVNAKNFAFNQPAHFASQLAERGADLVVVMIGANEAQWLGPGDQDTKEYQARFAALLAPIKTITPNASCLVVSPTDQAYVVGDGYASRPVMPYLIDAQRNAAKAAGCAFFSTYNWMGGKGSAAQWLKKGYIGTDFQHLSRKGASKLADALFRALITPARAH